MSKKDATEFEFFGRFLVKPKLYELENAGALGPMIEVRHGAEIGRFVNGVHDKTPLCRFEDLVEGMEIVAPSLVGYHRAVVARDEDGELYWKASEHFTGDLEFDTDDRHCWTTSAAFSGKGMRHEVLSSFQEMTPP